VKLEDDGEQKLPPPWHPKRIHKDIGIKEQRRLRSLYGYNKILFTKVTSFNSESLDILFKETSERLGEYQLVVNSSANNNINLKEEDFERSLPDLETSIDKRIVSVEVASLELVHDLTVRHLGYLMGGRGATLLNLSSGLEAAGRGGGQCTVLGVTRGLGLRRKVAKHGVKPISVYQPLIDYPDLSIAGQITDDTHSPYNRWSRYSAYIREYTGYMTLHLGDSALGGSVWKFNEDSRVSEVQPEDLKRSCGLANKMCFWLGCPKVSEDSSHQAETGKCQDHTDRNREEIIPSYSEEIR